MSARSVYISRVFLRCSTGKQSKSGIKKKRTSRKKSYDVYVDPEPMYRVTHALTSKQGGVLSAIFISHAIELCDVSRVVLHEAAAMMWIKSLFERIHFISRTAACTVKTCFKVNGILYGMQLQPCQLILIKYLIGVLAGVLKPLAECPLSIAEPCYIILSELFTLCGCFCHATSFRASGSCSVTLREWFVLPHPERVFMLRLPERVVRALSP